MTGVCPAMDRHLFEAFIESFTEVIADKVAERLGLRPIAKAVDRGFVAAAAEAAPETSSATADADYLDTKQVAKLLGISEGTLENWRCTGKGPKFTKFGSLVRYRRSDLGLK